MKWQFKARPLRVVDGDTIDFMVDLGFSVYHRVRVRLNGVDAPEIYGVKRESEEYQRGKAASEFAEVWLEDNINEDGHCYITTHQQTGKFGRYLADVHSGIDYSRNLNEDLVDEGYAEIYEG